MTNPIIEEKEKCWQGDDEMHRCSFAHCNHCGKCPADRPTDNNKEDTNK